jgi:hypothetical protein
MFSLNKVWGDIPSLNFGDNPVIGIYINLCRYGRG